MLIYTGHPLVDVGMATITVFSHKSKPEEVNTSDLENIADYMAQNYIVNPLRSFLTVAFPNSGFTQPAYFDAPEKQAIYAERVLRAFRTETPLLEEIDVFTGMQASAISFDVKGELPLGKAFRQHIPLLTGEDVINFHPCGGSGLPVSGLTLLAIQAFPLGCAKCGGRLLAVHSDNPEIMQHFVGKFLEQNLSAVSLAQAGGGSKMPETHLKYRTLLIDTLLKAGAMQLEVQDVEPFSVTTYHLTNSGQGVDLAIYHLPSQVIIYLKEMLSADYVHTWSQIVSRAWELPKPQREQITIHPDFTPSRNHLYEDLFRVAENCLQYAPRFIRTYFLRDALRYVQNNLADPRSRYSLKQDANLVSWKLTQSFLWRIMHMDNDRVKNIRDLGDALADYVKGQNDKRFFYIFYSENRYGYLRNALIKANTTYVKRGNPPFLTLDNYICVFEDGEDLAQADWRLARDLVLIRMVEQLHKNGWLGDNQDAIPENVEETESEAQ